MKISHKAPLVKKLVNALLFLAHGVRRHRVTFQLADGEAGELSVVGRFKADCTGPHLIGLCRRQIA